MGKVKAVPASFKTSDGKTFETQVDAERHQAVVEAKAKFADAQRALAHAMVQAYKTADGQPFEFGSSIQYYAIHYMGDFPRLRRVDFWGWYCQRFEMTEYGDLRIFHGGDVREKSYCVSELYRSKDAALAELRKRQEEAIGHYREEMERGPRL